MSFAIADEYRVIAIDEDTMRPGHPASQRVAIRTSVARAVWLFAITREQFNRHLTNINHADRMAFSVGQKYISVWSDAEAFRTGERRQFRRAAVPSESFLSGSGNVMNGSGFHIDSINCVSFAQRQPHISTTVKI